MVAHGKKLAIGLGLVAAGNSMPTFGEIGKMLHGGANHFSKAIASKLNLHGKGDGGSECTAACKDGHGIVDGGSNLEFTGAGGGHFGLKGGGGGGRVRHFDCHDGKATEVHTTTETNGGGGESTTVFDGSDNGIHLDGGLNTSDDNYNNINNNHNNQKNNNEGYKCDVIKCASGLGSCGLPQPCQGDECNFNQVLTYEKKDNTTQWTGSEFKPCQDQSRGRGSEQTGQWKLALPSCAPSTDCSRRSQDALPLVFPVPCSQFPRRRPVRVPMMPG